MTTAHKATTAGLADINQERADILRRVLSSVLREDIVKEVLAQVIDGLPVAKTYELTITRRFELLSRVESSQDSRTISHQFCSSREMLENLGLNAKVRPGLESI